MKKQGFKFLFQIPHSEFALTDRPAAFCGSQAERLGEGLTRPMLTASNALAPGPQLKFPGNVNPPEADCGQSRGFTLRKSKGGGK